MIPVVAQSLAKVLAAGTSLSGLEQIDFNPPSSNLLGQSALTVYCYDIQECLVAAENTKSYAVLCSGSVLKSLRWFKLAFLISAWDYTALGEQQLLSEALASLADCHLLRLNSASSDFQESEEFPIEILSTPTSDSVMLWSSLGLPIRPALYVTVTIPIFSRAGPFPREYPISSIDR